MDDLLTIGGVESMMIIVVDESMLVMKSNAMNGRRRMGEGRRRTPRKDDEADGDHVDKDDLVRRTREIGGDAAEDV
eukprot:50773-Eustigmatos_ZCMA.PRE.1